MICISPCNAIALLDLSFKLIGPVFYIGIVRVALVDPFDIPI